MSGESLVKERWRAWGMNLAYGAAWVALSLAGIVILLRVRDLALVLFAYIGAGHKLVAVCDRVGLIALGLVWIALVGVLESYLRAGAREGKLGARILRIGAAEAAFLGLYYLFSALVARSTGGS